MIVDNIDTIYQKASPEQYNSGFNWYLNAHNYCQEIATKFDIPFHKVVGVCAVLSPQSNWTQNKQNTHNYFSKDPMQFISKMKIEMMAKVLEDKAITEVTKGQKVTSFYYNILSAGESSDYVTIDTHAIKVALGVKDDRVFASKKRYSEISDGYKEVANKYNIPAPKMQAICWTVQRGSAD